MLNESSEDHLTLTQQHQKVRGNQIYFSINRLFSFSKTITSATFVFELEKEYERMEGSPWLIMHNFK